MSKLIDATWSLDDARDDFISDVYNTLDFLPTNIEANRIIDSFDRVTSGVKQEPCENAVTITPDRIKQAREEIEQNAYPIVHGANNHDMGMTLNGIFQVLDKLITEVEE